MLDSKDLADMENDCHVYLSALLLFFLQRTNGPPPKIEYIKCNREVRIKESSAIPDIKILL